jgi:hypothetical protein
MGKKFEKWFAKFPWFDVFLICIILLFILCLGLLLISILKYLIFQDCLKLYWLTNSVPKMCNEI